jgi:hypothetical protein
MFLSILGYREVSRTSAACSEKTGSSGTSPDVNINIINIINIYQYLSQIQVRRR